MYEVREEPNDLDPTTTMRICYSTKDGGYIGLEDVARQLCVKRGIQPECRTGHKVCSVGWCEKDQRWYGWSHRAIYGFGIGSTVKKGDLAYIADTPEGLIDDHAEFFADISADCAAQKRAECQILPDRSGIRILHAPMMLPITTLDKIGDVLSGDEEAEPTLLFEDAVSVIKCGRGEWTAKTLADAYQMACDFAEGVS
jgi:hypothetical protein